MAPLIQTIAMQTALAVQICSKLARSRSEPLTAKAAGLLAEGDPYYLDIRTLVSVYFVGKVK